MRPGLGVAGVHQRLQLRTVDRDGYCFPQPPVVPLSPVVVDGQHSHARSAVAGNGAGLGLRRLGEALGGQDVLWAVVGLAVLEHPDDLVAVRHDLDRDAVYTRGRAPVLRPAPLATLSPGVGLPDPDWPGAPGGRV